MSSIANIVQEALVIVYEFIYGFGQKTAWSMADKTMLTRNHNRREKSPSQRTFTNPPWFVYCWLAVSKVICEDEIRWDLIDTDPDE